MELANAPSQLVVPWANAGSKNNPIPIPSQIGITPGAASWTDGWPPLCDTPLSEGGIWPSMQDANGGLYQMSAVDVWMCAGGGFPYNSAFSASIGGYPKGARVLMASGNGYWVSTADNNVTDPDTGGSGWASADENAITALTGDVTAAGPGSAAATLAASGVAAGSYVAASVTFDAKGRATAASNFACTQSSNLAGSSRVSGTTYTNSTATPLFVEVVGEQTSGASGNGFILSAVCAGATVQANGPLLNDYSGDPGYASVSFWVPAGASYSVTLTNYSTSPTPTIIGWYEISFS